jgi:hypothetical protein
MMLLEDMGFLQIGESHYKRCRRRSAAEFLAACRKLRVWKREQVVVA